MVQPDDRIELVASPTGGHRRIPGCNRVGRIASRVWADLSSSQDRGDSGSGPDEFDPGDADALGSSTEAIDLLDSGAARVAEDRRRHRRGQR